MTEAAARLRPYASGLALDWLEHTPQLRHRSIDGSLVFVDISGFTTLTERLATKGKVGAEEMSDLLDGAFAALLQEAYAYGGSLVKWGGDAVLLLFEGPEHALLACRAAHEMRSTMRRTGRLRTSVGVVQLRMSVGVHSGSFDFFLGGTRHHELVVAGPAATRTAVMEQTADAGEIVVSPETAAELPPGCRGAAKGPGLLLHAAPRVDRRSRWWGPRTDASLIGATLDPALRDHLLTEVGDSEHRQVAVGFLEVSGLDGLLVEQGPGTVAVELHALLTLVQEQCFHHSVTFWETDISRDGFKVMLVAGAPRSTGHDEEGLLRAARAVLDAHSGPVRLRLGVNAGRVFSGGFGPPFRRTWSVKGDAVNLAARVMGRAENGELLATQALLDRVASSVEAVSLPPFLVKGKAHPVNAALVRSASGRGASAPSVRSGFLGRERELSQLARWAADASRGSGTAVMVTGDPGMGKTWLVERACEPLTGARVVVTTADPYEAWTPYVVLRRLLRGLLGARPKTSDVEVLGDLFFRVDGTPLAALLPLLGPVLGLDLPDTAETAAVQPRFRQARTARLVVDLVAQLALGPLVLVVDDVHNTESASVEVLAALARAATDHPWLLLLSGRSAPPALAELPAVGQLLVPPLPDDASRALVLARGGESLPPHVVRALVSRAEGNPLFLGELVAAAASGQGEELPATLEDLLATQVDALLPQQRQVLRVASVLGVRFDELLLTTLLDEPVRADTWSALRRYVVDDGAGIRRFRTGLVRDAAYEGLPFRRRVELHALAATALETRVSAEDDLAEALSLHSLAAR
ncbi:MAG: tetratricopeptide repeat protein, partial [Frankiales bacterium]|nr:tetratricopeptide repeat protein [Frankiales bacterium]